jgi:hypothetical protein
LIEWIDARIKEEPQYGLSRVLTMEGLKGLYVEPPGIERGNLCC